MATHNTENEVPEFKHKDDYEFECFNHIWHPLESKLRAKFKFKSNLKTEEISHLDATKAIVRCAERQLWPATIDSIQEFHSMLLPLSSYEYRLPSRIKAQYGEEPGQAPPSLEYVVFALVALSNQLVAVAAESPDDIIKYWAGRANTRLLYLVAHLLRQRSRSRSVMMLPSEFFQSKIIRDVNIVQGVRAPVDLTEHRSEPTSSLGHFTPPHSHESIVIDSSPSPGPAELPRQRRSPAHVSAHPTPPAANEPQQNDLVNHPPGTLRTSPESTNSGAQVLAQADLGMLAINSNDKRARAVTISDDEDEEEVSPPQPKPKRQKGEGVTPRTNQELQRARKWEGPAHGELAPQPCVRCAALANRIGSNPQCWIPKPEFQNKHGMTCAYCRSQKTKCSLHPKYKDEKPEFFLNKKKKSKDSADATEPIASGSGNGQTSGPSNQLGAQYQLSTPHHDDSDQMLEDDSADWIDVEDDADDEMDWEE